MERFILTIGRLRVHKVKPIFLVAIYELIIVRPVRFHDLLVVVLDKRLEDARLFFFAGVDLGKQAINEESIDHYGGLLAPDRRSRHVQSVPVADLNLVHEELGRDGIEPDEQVQAHSTLAVLSRE